MENKAWEDSLVHLFDHHSVERLHDPERVTFQDPSRLFPLIRSFQKGNSAEIGAGSGYFFFPLCEYLNERGICYAIELQPEMLVYFEKERSKRLQNLSIQTLLGSAESINLPDKSLELIWMVNVFHELTSARQVLKEVYRVLAISGQFFIIDWKKEETPVGPPISERASEVSLYDHLIDAGFTRIRSHDLYPYHYVVEAIKD